MKIASTLLVTLLLISHATTAQQLDMLASSVQLQLESGQDVNQTIEGEGTLLQVAAKTGNGELVKLLVDAGADTNLVSDYDDQPPLTLAIRLDDLEVLELLVEHGADLNSEDSNGRTPIFKTLKPDRPATRGWLIEKGADVNKSIDGGVTVIVEAISSLNINAIEQLVASDATINGRLVAEAICESCHSYKEFGEHPYIPYLAGQHAEYTAIQLGDFHKKKRINFRMDRFSDILVEEINVELASYYESLPRRKNQPSGTVELQAKGKLSYDENCSSCHGTDGIDTQNKLTPTLAGLSSTYVGNQMRAYKSGERANDADAVMRKIAAELTRDQIFEVSEYIHSMY